MSKIDIIELENDRLKWSLQNFTDATPLSSLEKLKEEIKEIQSDIQNGHKRPVEYADALMCLFDSAGRNGISVLEILIAFEEKARINKLRKWKKNNDNTYSHI